MRNTVTIKENREFSRLYRIGKFYSSDCLILYLRKNKLDKNRIGVTVSKKVGKAVIRNRVRRRIKESYREIEGMVNTSYEQIFDDKMTYHYDTLKIVGTENGRIKLICSEYAGTNVDIPALPQDMYSLTDDKSVKAVIDVGGDDRGALALGRLSGAIIEENDYEMLLVINKFRPLTPDAASTVEVMREIEFAAGVRFTGVVNNSNVGDDTSEEDVLDSLDYAERVASLAGIPLRFTTVRENLYENLKTKINGLMPIKICVRQSF